MAVPGPWPVSLKLCKTHEAALTKSIKTQADAKKAHIAKEKIYEELRVKVCLAAGYDLKKGGEGPSRKRAEDAMQKDGKLKALTKELEALEKLMEPDLKSKDLLKAELKKLEGLLAGPDLKGTDGKGKGIPPDILKFHKEGTVYIVATRKKFEIR